MQRVAPRSFWAPKLCMSKNEPLSYTKGNRNDPSSDYMCQNFEVWAFVSHRIVVWAGDGL